MADTTTLATVEFHGAHLVTTLVDGVPHVALRPICEAVGLDWNGQYQRLMRHAVLAPTVCMTHTVADDGKLREISKRRRRNVIAVISAVVALLALIGVIVPRRLAPGPEERLA